MVDLIKPHFSMTDARATLLSKMLALMYGIVCLVMAYVVHLMNSSVLQAALSIFGMVGGPLLGLFCLGIFFPCANSIGAATGLAAGLLMAFWVGIGGFFSGIHYPVAPLLNSTNTEGGSNISTNVMATVTDPNMRPGSLHDFYSLSYMWYSALNSSTVVLMGLVISFLTGPSKVTDVRAGTVYPVFERGRTLLEKLMKTSTCCTSAPDLNNDGHKGMNGTVKEDAGALEETETFLSSDPSSHVELETSL
ncbi:hypothetical protein DNTS_016241 [Danionella cerebrum]|uniref:Sodium-dependent multivitamin transporter n=1 Tax=Danionella cerebrum TaxID=2873325 RepID=A0A553Q0R5_9TELE|nr:hypothetical protein DNTS_016241 [Danionella translucida]